MDQAIEACAQLIGERPQLLSPEDVEHRLEPEALAHLHEPADKPGAHLYKLTRAT